MALLAFLLPFFLFISFPSRMWNFDGVACAAALELGNPVFLFHSNHLLYGFLGFLFWEPLRGWALPRALPSLQLFTSVLAAGALTGLYAILHTVLENRRLALLLTLSLSVSAVVWVWSVEAQVYALGFLALSGATVELMQPERPRKWLRVGALHAGAVLGHIVHVLWLVPALYWLAKENPRMRRQNLRHYLWPLAIGTAIPYALVIAWIIIPWHPHDRWLIKWLLGSASLNPHSVFQWHSAGISGPLQWAMVTPRIFWGSFWPYHTLVPTWAVFSTALSIAIVIFLLGMSWKHRTSRRWVFSALWLAVYGVFFWTWEPTTECYRMTDMVPLAILMALGLSTLKPVALRWGLPVVLLATLLPVNLVTRIMPMHDAQNNALYQETRALEKVTPSSALYLTVGGSSWLYLLYFSGRSAWDLHAFERNPEHLDKEIKRHLGMQPIFIQEQALQLDDMQARLSHFHLKPIGNGLPWDQVQ